jgi:hypothetical protein
MPTFTFFINGKEVDRLQGANKSALEEKINQLRMPVTTMTGKAHRLDDDEPMPAAPANDGSFQMLKEMGFADDRIQAAFKAVGAADVERAIDWINENMEESVQMTDEKPAEGPVVHNAICNECKKQIIGVRHKCLTCYDTDFCSECVGKHDPSHPIEKYEENVEITHTKEQVLKKMQEYTFYRSLYLSIY